MIYNYIVEIDRKKTFNPESDINELIQYIDVTYWSNVLRITYNDCIKYHILI